ncbi:hypothetical protein [uncultured Bradyrhizobium sp.]|uniref:hypothetical protein n=1 Tax=uncultured Bradyrhizobium sp. TaxID=199684 RepID=UPI0035CB3964
MRTYRLIVVEEEGARTFPIDQETIDQSPALKAIVERSFKTSNREGLESVGFDQSYDETPKHDNYHEDRTRPDGYGKSYTRKIP